MSGISRKRFLKTATALAASPAAMALQANQAASTSGGDWDPDVMAATPAFRLELAGPRLAVRLWHVPSGLLLADGPYSYSFGAPVFSTPGKTERGGETVITWRGEVPSGIGVTHEFRIPANEPWLEERITLTNQTAQPVLLPHLRCGFVLPVDWEGSSVRGPLKDFKFTAVPFRREPQGDRRQYADYTFQQVLTEPRTSVLRVENRVSREGNIVIPVVYASGVPPTLTAEYASEGWVLTDGRSGFLFTKYSQDGMEFALLDRLPWDQQRTALRWGGCGVYLGDPETGAFLEPHGSHAFGVTRLTAYSGGTAEGFYTYRAETESRGHTCPAGFDPPVHWNELYDNKLWHLGGVKRDQPENMKKYYRLEDMRQEAAKAKEIGCEALYLDPGWDTNFASKIWDESRLGKTADFAEMLRREYGLRLSLHAPLSGWCNPTSYPREADRLDRNGTRVEYSLCGASRQYIDETLARLDKLARAGAVFFMFDGTMYHGECWDPQHGHRVPARREEHVQATNRLARLVHARHPQVLIEMHDQMVGGSRLRHVPLYYGHGKGMSEGAGEVDGFDTIWGFELMWDPMTDLVDRHSIALYYYNLAYSVPLYLHIDLRKDNEQALMFWWNASTCRHLGVGGKHKDPAVWQAHKAAMAEYRRLKPFFTQGTFYGIDELTHVHRHPSEEAAVVNCFNLENRPDRRQFTFDLARHGLLPAANFEVRGGEARRSAGGYSIEVEVPAYGHTLVEVRKTA